MNESTSEYAPDASDSLPEESLAEALVPMVDLLAGKRVVLLTGAGCSTESGIPDYRGPKTRHKTRNPVMYKEFVEAAANRSRYWARSVVGWPRFLQARPNATHKAIAAMEASGIAVGVITQNVDRLHQVGGSQRVIELHGALAEVRCLDCQLIEDRDALQDRLLALNPHVLPDAPVSDAKKPELAPDGDAEIPLEQTRDFQVAPCLRCGGMIKPNVVFFGESVPKVTVDAAWRMIDEADALLVVGSSLTVYSGYRFVRGAEKRDMPIAILNLGETRGDPHAHVKLEATTGLAMPLLGARLAERMS